MYFDGNGIIKAYSVASCPLENEKKRFLRRYLDVTKAQLFFCKGVILVEGISEALLLPELAKILGYSLEERGISIVNVQSLAFQPFAKLFQEKAMNTPAAIISDADPPEDVLPESLDFGLISDVGKAILQLESGTLRIFLATKTLEYDLALAGNAQRMAEEYKKLRPQRGKAMLEAVVSSKEPLEQVKSFWRHFGNSDKARFAQILAESLSKTTDGFAVPQYIVNAVKHVVGAVNE